MASMILRKFPFATNSAPRYAMLFLDILTARWETYAQIVALGKEKFTDELERRWQQGGLEILGTLCHVTRRLLSLRAMLGPSL